MIESITFVVPTYRTADTLPVLVGQIDTIAPTLAHHHAVIVIDDFCPQRSGAIVEGCDGVTVHRFDTNRGQRAAVLAGLALADSAVVCTLDADLQDDPASVLELVAALEATGADVVCAGRRGDYTTPWRRWQASGFRRLRWVLSRGRIPPDAGLFHVATARAVRQMAMVAAADDDPLVAYARSGASIVAIPIHRRDRPSGRSSYTHLARLKMARTSLYRLVAAGRSSSVAESRTSSEKS